MSEIELEVFDVKCGLMYECIAMYRFQLGKYFIIEYMTPYFNNKESVDDAIDHLREYYDIVGKYFIVSYKETYFGTFCIVVDHVPTPLHAKNEECITANKTIAREIKKEYKLFLCI